MSDGKLKNPEWLKLKCQYCEEEFDYYREYSAIRKACPKCLPDGKHKDIVLVRKLIKLKAIRYKGGKCACCGEIFPPVVYDFHHLNPKEKDFGLGDKASTTKWDLIQKELDKCILVCANCHRMIHSGDLALEQ